MYQQRVSRAQTTPTKVVVLGENEIALKQIEAAKNATPAPTSFT